MEIASPLTVVTLDCIQYHFPAWFYCVKFAQPASWMVHIKYIKQNLERLGAFCGVESKDISSPPSIHKLSTPIP